LSFDNTTNVTFELVGVYGASDTDQDISENNIIEIYNNENHTNLSRIQAEKYI